MGAETDRALKVQVLIEGEESPHRVTRFELTEALNVGWEGRVELDGDEAPDAAALLGKPFTLKVITGALREKSKKKNDGALLEKQKKIIVKAARKRRTRKRPAGGHIRVANPLTPSIRPNLAAKK